MLVQECANSYGYKLQIVYSFETAFSTSKASFEAIASLQTITIKTNHLLQGDVTRFIGWKIKRASGTYFGNFSK